jgi:CheY-like chemotaxis protein
MEGPVMPIRGLINDLTRTLTGSLVHMDNLLLHMDNDSAEFDEAWLANHQLSRALEFFIELRSEYMLQHDSINQNETKPYKPTAVERLLHDFNNLLAVILGYCEKIQNDFADIGHMSTNIDYIFTKIKKSSHLLNELYFNKKQSVSFNRLSLPFNKLNSQITMSIKNYNSSSRVFLIEDDDEINEIIRYFLCKHGYTVVACSKGYEAVAIFNNINADFDIYIIDVELPDIEGPDLIKNILLNNKDINVLFISGYNETTLKKRYALMNQYPILTKPFRLEELLHKVKSTIIH